MNRFISDNWFYSSPNKILRIFTVFIKGDSLIILPFALFALFMIVLSWKLGLLIILIFLSLRFVGEMIYWLLQQFSKKDYRPFDFGFKQLSNNSIYILYQLMSLVWATLSISGLIYFLVSNPF